MGGNWVDSNDFESRGSCYVHVPDVCPPVDFAQHSRSMTATTTCYETGGATKINGMGSFIMNDTKKQNKCVRRKKTSFVAFYFESSVPHIWICTRSNSSSSSLYYYRQDEWSGPVTAPLDVTFTLMWPFDTVSFPNGKKSHQPENGWPFRGIKSISYSFFLCVPLPNRLGARSTVTYCFVTSRCFSILRCGTRSCRESLCRGERKDNNHQLRQQQKGIKPLSRLRQTVSCIFAPVPDWPIQHLVLAGGNEIDSGKLREQTRMRWPTTGAFFLLFISHLAHPEGPHKRGRDRCWTIRNLLFENFDILFFKYFNNKMASNNRRCGTKEKMEKWRTTFHRESRYGAV